MKAVVVYESLWGNTAAIARAIAEGIGPEARALSTAQATAAELAGVDLIVAGAPVIGFRAPSDQTLKQLGLNRVKEKAAPDLSQPSMRSWLDALPPGQGRSAAFETRIWWSPGSATSAIERGLAKAGYPSFAKAGRFIVKGKHGPLRAGELERAKQWGARLAQEAGGR